MENSSVCVLTCFHLEGERAPAVVDEPIELEWRIWNREVEHLDDFVRLIEVDHFFLALVLALNVIQANLDHSKKELSRLLVCILVVLER